MFAQFNSLVELVKAEHRSAKRRIKLKVLWNLPSQLLRESRLFVCRQIQARTFPCGISLAAIAGACSRRPSCGDLYVVPAVPYN